MILSDKFFENKMKVAFTLILPAFIVYVKSIGYGFTTLDEQWMIVNNVSFFEDWHNFKIAFIKPIAGLYYRPLLLTSIFLDYHINKLSPAVYHFTNLVYHLISVLLLLKLLCLSGVTKKNAFLYALIFSVHPVLVHAVVWVPGRNDTLLCIFTLASLINLFEYFINPKRKFMLLHFLFFACALLTKENAVILPFIFIAQYFAYKKSTIKGFGLLCLGWVLLSVTLMLARHLVLPGSELIPGKENLHVTGSNFVQAILLYTGKALFPVQQSVLPLLSHSSVIPGLLAFGILIFLIIRPGIADRKRGLYGLFIFFTMLSIPVWFNTSRHNGEQYEHRIYTSLAGMMLFFSQIKFNVNSKAFLYTVLVIFSLFFIKTFVRMDVYKNKEVFLNAGITESPDFYLFLFQKSEAFCAQRNYDSALVYCNKTIVLRPNSSNLYGNRGTIYYELKRYEEAVHDFTKAIALSTQMDYRFYLNRCVAYLKLGKKEKALQDLVFLKKCCQPAIPPGLEKAINNK